MSDAHDRLAGLDPERPAQLAEGEPPTCGGCGRRVSTAGQRPDAHNVSPWWCTNCGGDCLPLAPERKARPADQHPELPVGFVKEAPGLGYFVKSRSTEGAWWLIAGRTCSCPAGRAGRERCWHRSQVAAFVAKINEAHKRPTAPPNISALVD